MTDVRVGVVGAGVMGSDHIKRIAESISGAAVVAVIEPDEERARASLRHAPRAATFARLEDALARGSLDALLVASPGRFHEEALMTILQAGVPVLCEKPLTEDSASAMRIAEAEQRGGRRLIQVGFMRRYDAQYRELRRLVSSGDAGALLMLHCAHRAPSVPDAFTQEMRITDSAAHEFDIVPWLAGEGIRSIRAQIGRVTSLAGPGVREPILLIIELGNGLLVNVEINLSARFGYQVTTEAVFERGVARIGQPAGLQLWSEGEFRIAEHELYTSRFHEAYTAEIQEWVDGVRRGAVGGPSVWDGFKVAAACEAGLEALARDEAVALDLPDTPELYRSA